MATAAQFQRTLIGKLLTLGARRVRPKIPSKTLRLALQKRVSSDTEGSLFIPHYWAIYVHDGRAAPFGPRPGGVFLVFWRNPANDPRLINGKTPERASQLRSLTQREFREAARQEHEARLAGRPSPVTITRQVKKRTIATPFFENRGRGGMRGFLEEANKEGQARFREFLFDSLRSVLGLRSRAPVRLAGGLGISLTVERIKATIPLG